MSCPTPGDWKAELRRSPLTEWMITTDHSPNLVGENRRIARIEMLWTTDVGPRGRDRLIAEEGANAHLFAEAKNMRDCLKQLLRCDDFRDADAIKEKAFKIMARINGQAEMPLDD